MAIRSIQALPEPVQRVRARRYITLKAAAEGLACSERTLRRMIAAGELTAYRVGNRLIRLDADELDALVRVVPTLGTVD